MVHAYANFAWLSESCRYWLVLLLNFTVMVIAIQSESEGRAKCSLTPLYVVMLSGNVTLCPYGKDIRGFASLL